MGKFNFKAIKSSISSFYSRKDGKALVNSVLLSVLLILFAYGFQYYYVVNYLAKIDVAQFQKVLSEKEMMATQTLMKIKEDILRGGVESLHRNKDLYDQSSEDLVYHIYKGDELLFWSSKSMAVDDISDFEFKRRFFYRVENAYALVIQSFYREYCCVCFIKIKDIVPLRKNEAASFAKGFNLPGNIAISADNDPYFLPIYSSDGQYLFSIQDASLSHKNYPLYVGVVVLWSLTLISLIFLSYYFIQLNIGTSRVGKILKGVFLFLLWGLILKFALYDRQPYAIFSVGWLASVKFDGVEFMPSLAYLFFYTLFVYTIFFLIRKKTFFANWCIKNGNQRVRFIVLVVLLKLLSFLLFVAFFYAAVTLILSSDMNVAVSNIHEVKLQTTVLLLFILLWGILLFWLIGKISNVYAQKKYFGLNILIHLFLTLLVAFLMYSLWGFFAVKILLIFSLLLLFFDFVLSFFSEFSFILLSILSLGLILMVVYMCYIYGEEKNELHYRAIVDEVVNDNCVWRDKVSESVLAEKDYYIRTDDRLQKLVKTETERDSVIEQYIRNAYLRFFDEKYEVHIQICDSAQMLSIMGHDFNNRFYYSFNEVEDKFRKIDQSKFYANTSESLPIAYLGIFDIENRVVYLKFYPKVNRIKKDKITDAEVESGVSLAKYTKGELTYYDGTFRYPSIRRWIPESELRSYSFEANYCKHYVSTAPESDSLAIVSVPERQTYIFIVFVTYLFAFFLLVSLIVFAYNLFRRRVKMNRQSLLTRMQTIFVVPVMLTFLMLAVMTFPFFLTQYEEAQQEELKRNASAVQESVQSIMGQSVDMTDLRPVLNEEIKELAKLFHLDILLYDNSGHYIASSRPIYTEVGKVEAYLVEPQVKFGGKLDYFCVESVGQNDYYSYYTSVYNNLNETVGYINLVSSSAYNYVRNEVFNILVVIIDIYVFITLLSIFIIWLLNRQTTRPLSLLTEHFAQIRLTGQNTQIEYKRDDEIGELVEQYNKMVEQLMNSAENLARSEREFAWREMARRIAHEIKNPLTPMKLSVQQCQRKRTMDPENFDEYFNKTCNILIDQIDNLSNIASEFSSFAKASESKGVKMDIVEKLESTVELFASNSEEVSFSLNLNGHKHEYVLMDDKQILQVFNNLFRNAIQAIPDDRNGLVNVSLCLEDDNVLIEIRDNGCGIPPENRVEMFRPNFTTKTSGMGLGLAIVKNILLAARGDIWFESEVNVGTSFFVKIPLYKDDDSVGGKE